MTDAAAGTGTGEGTSSNGTTPKIETVPTEKYLKEQARAVDAEKRLEAFKNIDPEEYKAIKEDYENMRKTQTGGDPKKIEELIAAKDKEIRSSVQKVIDEKEQRISTLSTTLKELQVTDRVFSKAASVFNADCHDDVKSYIRKFGDVGEDGEIFFKDDKGNPRYAPGSTTKLMGSEDFVKWLADTKPSWAVAEGTGGAKGSGNKTKVADMSQPLTRQMVDATPDQGASLFKELCKTPEGYAQVQAYLLNGRQ